jgi:hypothetical protein
VTFENKTKEVVVMATRNEDKRKKFEIVDGPGKFDLMLAIFGKKEIVFTVKVDDEKIKITVNLTCIGSHWENTEIPTIFIIRGYGHKGFSSPYTKEDPATFRIEYGIKTRGGTLEMI